VIPVHTFLPNALADLLGQAPFSAGKLRLAWKVAVGPAIDRVTAISLATDGTLVVRVAGPLWRREVERSRPVILDRLGFLLGAGVVRGIELRD
jgi:hypothetical protein